MFVISLLGRALGWLCLTLGLFCTAAWAGGALYFDGPFGALNAVLAAGVLLALLAVLFFVRPGALKVAVYLAICAGVAGWWFTLEPSNDRHWQADVAQTPWAETDGESITVHNLRNCDYRSATDYTPHWESRTVRLSDLTGLELFLGYFGSPHFAHPIASFQFADSPPICFSIETRREVGEAWSPVAGFFRHYELIYVMADERDVVRARTNYRKDEEMYLFRLKTSPEMARVLFLDYLRRANQLNKEPEWYNAITDSFANAVRFQTQAIGSARPWDWRLLLTGHMDARAYDLGMLDTSLAFADLKRLSRINGHARVADPASDFSTQIRAALPGFSAAR